ncbi:RNA polymerase sigma factor [Pseudomonas fragi]|uniref:RNA polymerase sigma factor n=1 Tax=Pseudomonas fragi TaxID=296 RepID=A0A449IF17_PSEFR|nr:RNA polymerase sigma factor [Pseudomonas fragi]
MNLVEIQQALFHDPALFRPLGPDALQEWKRLTARETPAPGEPRAFLTVVAKRVLFNHYRRQDLERAYLQALADLPEQVAPSEEERAIILQTLMELDQLLDGLPSPASICCYAR